jgi:hypothetical protein
VPVDDGHAVRTHDGQWTLVRDDGTLRPGLGSVPLVDAEEATAAMLRGFRGEPEPELASGGVVTGNPVVVGERGPEEIVVPDAKVVSKRRSRS